MINIWAVVIGLGLMVLAGVMMIRWRGSSNNTGGRGQRHASAARRRPVLPAGYSPKNVGNDASARPWESTYVVTPKTPGQVDPAWDAPDGFDLETFIGISKAHFISLQDAWNKADIPRLRAMMTEEMLTQIQGKLAERERQEGATARKNEVVMVEARLLGIEDLGDGHMANVEFSGLMREGSAGPSPFREIWSIARAKTGSDGWLVAGVQALQ